MLHLVFVGPEIAEIDDGVEVAPPSPRLSAECVRGTLGALLAQRPQLTAANTMCVGFNTGMGSGLYPLMQSWLRGSMGQSAPLWHRPSSAPAPPRGAPDGSGRQLRRCSQAKGSGHCPPSHCLGCSRQPPPKSSTSTTLLCLGRTWQRCCGGRWCASSPAPTTTPT